MIHLLTSSIAIAMASAILSLAAYKFLPNAFAVHYRQLVFTWGIFAAWACLLAGAVYVFIAFLIFVKAR